MVMTETLSGSAQGSQEPGIQSSPEAQGTAGAHTPGPWVVREYENVRAARADGEFSWANPDSVMGDCFHGQPVGTVWQTVDGAQTGLPGSIEVSLANARLIAAAPDLLAVCRSLAAVMAAWGPERRGETLALIHAANEAAIAKAVPRG